MSQWDYENGVWLDNRASNAMDISDLPDPLYILGYGSLIWKPSELLSQCLSYKCTALQWKRMFAQRSCDHRGTPQFPGLVLNLVKDSDLVLYGYKSSCSSINRSYENSSFKGLLYLIPTHLVRSVIDDLDYRERGGYERHLISVKLDSDTLHHKKGDIINALVYTGLKENPMFYLPDISINTLNNTNEVAMRSRYHKVMSIISDTIATAVGPSGANVDYLCNLDSYLRSELVAMHDPSLTELACRVRLQLGIWRSRILRNKAKELTNTIHKSMQLLDSNNHSYYNIPHQSSQVNKSRNILGWGSNEFLQLSDSYESLPASRSSSTLQTILNSSDMISNIDTVDWQLHYNDKVRSTHRYYAMDIKKNIPRQYRTDRKQTIGHQQQRVVSKEISQPSFHHNDVDIQLDTNTTTTTISLSNDILEEVKNNQLLSSSYASLSSEELKELEDMEHEYVVAGGGTSCYVHRQRALIWGKLVPSILSHIQDNINNKDINDHLGTKIDNNTRDDASSYRYEDLNQSIAIDGVLGVAIGHDHMLLLVEVTTVPSVIGNKDTDDNSLKEIILGFGNNAYGQCNGLCEPLDNIILVYSTEKDVYNISYKDHKALERMKNNLSNNKDRDNCSNVSKQKKKIVKLATGLRHSVAITECGTFYGWGDNRYGQISIGGITTTDQQHHQQQHHQQQQYHQYDHNNSLSSSCIYEWKPQKETNNMNEGVIIDVACGTKYTILIDNHNNVYYLGTDITKKQQRQWQQKNINLIHDSTNRSSETSSDYTISPAYPKLIRGLPMGIRWRKVASGWSHFIIKGILPAPLSAAASAASVAGSGGKDLHNKAIFVGGGKRNLGQYPILTPSMNSNNHHFDNIDDNKLNYDDNVDFNVSILGELPTKTNEDDNEGIDAIASISEVWCGSEYTIVADDDNYLWACGWNDHGNLGIGNLENHSEPSSSNTLPTTKPYIADTWRPVLRYYNHMAHYGKQQFINSTTCDDDSGSLSNVTLSSPAQVRLPYTWEGSLSCGGAHTICLE